MNSDPRYLRDLLEYPSESQQRDYKAAVKFSERDEFSLKLVKHILGFANSGAGYIIIGYREVSSRMLTPDPAMSEDIAASYEVTRLCQFVNKFTTGQEDVEIVIDKPTHSGKVFPIIRVLSFRDYPFVCTESARSPRTQEPILEAGVIYVRTRAAQTVVLKSPSHWHDLINQCIAARERSQASLPPSSPEEDSGGIGVKVKPKGPVKPTTTSPREKAKSKKAPFTRKEQYIDYQAWVENHRKEAQKFHKQNRTEGGLFEFVVQMPHSIRARSSHDLINVAEKSECANTGWPIGVTMTKPEYMPRPFLDGIRASIATGESYDYWALHKSGHFFFLRDFHEEQSVEARRELKNKHLILFDTRIWRIAESLLYVGNLCRELDVSPDEAIMYQITHSGLRNRVLGVSSPNRARFFRDIVSIEDSVTTRLELRPGEIAAHLKDIVYTVSSELFDVFEAYKSERAIVDSVVDEFLTSRISR